MDRLSNVRDIFLFCCYTGLAYVDVKQLKRTDMVTGTHGDLWIDSTRQKTDSATRILLLPTALEIMKKYEDDPLCSNRGVVPPVLSNQKIECLPLRDRDFMRHFKYAHFSYRTSHLRHDGNPQQ